MGKDIENEVIDLQFASLTRKPQAVFELGREDITTERPGQIMLEAVEKFAADGGFRKLQEAQDEKNQMERVADSKIGKREMKEFNIPLTGVNPSSLDVAKENDD